MQFSNTCIKVYVIININIEVNVGNFLACMAKEEISV